MLMTSVYTLINIPLLVRLLFITQLENVDCRISLPLQRLKHMDYLKKHVKDFLSLASAKNEFLGYNFKLCTHIFFNAGTVSLFCLL